MPKILCLPDGKTIAARPTDTILAAALEAGVPHAHACGGTARCSTCRVWVLEGLESCSPRTPREQALAEALHFDAQLRLACQTRVSGDVKIRRLVLDEEDIEVTSLLGGSRLGRCGEAKNVVVLFCDIRGFTTFSESLSPYDVMFVLNRFFHQAGEAVERNGGYVDNFIGDALMALFGIDGDEKAPLRSVAAALQVLDAMDRLKPYLEAMYGQGFDIGIGLHYGEAVIGSVGTARNEKLTAIGDTVNVASRIEAANKEAGTRLLISEELFEKVRDEVEVADFIRTRLRGTSERKTLYEIKGLTASAAGALAVPAKEGVGPRRHFAGLEWEPVLAEAELPPGTRKVIERADFDLLLIRTAEAVYAVNNACPHLNLPLNESRLTEDGGGIVCRWHESCFDLATGEIRRWCDGLTPDGISPTAPYLGVISKNRRRMTPFPASIAEGKVWVSLPP
jgi:class 3 adenylate cyclase/nitrite reductase/ring-hydroxylating ferredoxin subunit